VTWYISLVCEGREKSALAFSTIMTIYTLDTYVFQRRLLNPSREVIDKLIIDAGNKNVNLIGNDAMSMPLFECQEKPLDNSVYGIKWIKNNVTD
jgi:hypothetical protein